MSGIPTKDDIDKAHKRIAGHVHRTPILTSSSINKMAGANLYFKCENFQKIGAHKTTPILQRNIKNITFLVIWGRRSSLYFCHNSRKIPLQKQ